MINQRLFVEESGNRKFSFKNFVVLTSCFAKVNDTQFVLKSDVNQKKENFFSSKIFCCNHLFSKSK